MPTFIEFCTMVLEKIFKVAHAKNAKKKKKTVSGAATPTSNDECFENSGIGPSHELNNITLPEIR